MNKNSIVLSEQLSMIIGVSMINVESILSIIFMIISIALGILNLILVIKKAISNDGKLSEEEMDEISEKINETITEIQKFANKEDNNKGDNNDGQ